MKKLRRVLSWILILTLCCGEMTPQLAVYAAGEETVVEEEGVSISDDEAAVSDDEAVSEDAAEEEKIPEDAVSGDSVSEDEAAEEEETAVSENETVSEDEVTAPEDEQEPAAEEESGSGYEDGLISDDVEAGEESDDNADSFSRLTFKMKYDQKEGRNAGVSINAIRKDGKKDGLTYDNGLEQKATLRAAEAAIYYSNTRPDGRNYDTIYNDNDTAKGKARKEILIREGANGGEAANIFRSVSLNSLLSDSYHYMAVGHVVFQGTHYWALELTEFPTNLANRNPRVEDVNVTIDVLDKFLSNKDVSASLAAGTKIKVDTNVAKDLPTFSGYVVSREHKPENAKLPVITDAPVWKADNKLQASIKNNKLTVKADEGTDGNITATIKLANKEFSFTYPVHVIVHVKSISISVNNTVVALDDTTTATVKVLPLDADDTSFTLKADNDKVVRIKKPAKKNDPYVLEGAGAGKTKVWALPTDDYNKVKASVEITVDGDDEICDVYAIPGDVVISKDTRVRLSCDTLGADIYYLIYGYVVHVDEDGSIEWEFGEEDQKKRAAVYTPGKETEDNAYFTKYSEPITISGNSYIRAVAVKEALDVSGNKIYKVSDHTDWLYMLDSNDWGDVITLDRGEYETPADLPKGLWVAEASMPELTYTGKALKPDSFRVYYNNRRLIYKKDYTIKYSNNINASTETSSANACFKFKGNIVAELNKSFYIAPADLSYAQVAGAGAVAGSTEKDIRIKLTLGGRKLKAGVDFFVDTDEVDLSKAGDYTVTIRGTGNYMGELKHAFKVVEKKKEIPAAEKLENFKKAVTIKLSQEVYDYSPDGCYPTVSVNKGSEVLTEGEDYLISYKNGDKAGKATVVVTGLEKAGYKGSISKKYKINKVDISKGQYEVSPDVLAIYQKGGTKIDMLVGRKNGDEYVYLREGIDYKVTYKNNKKAANQSAAKAPSFTVEGKGGYKGKLGPYKFSILPQFIGGLEGTATDVVWKNKPGNYVCKPVIYDTTGKKLKAGTDYDNKDLAYRYDENCYVHVKGKTAAELRVAGAPVGDDDIPDAGTLLHVRVNGKGNYTGSIRIRYRLITQSISKFKANIADQVYTGSEIILNRSDIRFTNGLKTNEFEIVGYSNNIEAGKASVTVRGLGNYGGTLTIKFNIVKLEKHDWINNWKGMIIAD
ncbi:MAG: chitobiase/beta-hexosaminidase C-terminal domain-containing protein [Lachnospiraceae bacterium]|nr:chitobiase/beta-hexosaminidase C-terminal domain-containing protein [Lachnospiraceae bacterium]